MRKMLICIGTLQRGTPQKHRALWVCRGLNRPAKYMYFKQHQHLYKWSIVLTLLHVKLSIHYPRIHLYSFKPIHTEMLPVSGRSLLQ